MNYLGCEFKDETITLTRLNEGVDIAECVFYNCHFDIKKPSLIYLRENKYYDCTFSLDLTSCKNEIEIDHDGILNYPEVKKYLDELIPSKCPKNEDFYGYKILFNAFHNTFYLAKLQIDAETLTANNGIVNKCRAEKAKVISIYNIGTEIKQHNSVFHNCFNYAGQNIEYTVGHNVYANYWDDNRFNVCTGGIHFYLDPITALRLQYHCGKFFAEEFVSMINKIEPDFYPIGV
jgi:hypothetical protein